MRKKGGTVASTLYNLLWDSVRERLCVCVKVGVGSVSEMLGEAGTFRTAYLLSLLPPRHDARPCHVSDLDSDSDSNGAK